MKRFIQPAAAVTPPKLKTCTPTTLQRGVRGAVAREMRELLAGIGVRHQAHRVQALRLQRAQRGAHAAALREAQQRAGRGGAGQPDVDRHAGRAARQRRAVLDHTRRREGELRHHVGAEALRRGERRASRRTSRSSSTSGNARVALRVAGQPDLAQAARGERAAADQRRAVGVGPARLGLVAAEDQRLAHAGLRDRAREEAVQLGAAADAPRGDVRHRLEARFAHRGERGERVGEAVARQVVDVDGRAGRQQRGDRARVLRAVRAHLDRARRDEVRRRQRRRVGFKRACGRRHRIRPGTTGRRAPAALRAWHRGTCARRSPCPGARRRSAPRTPRRSRRRTASRCRCWRTTSVGSVCMS